MCGQVITEHISGFIPDGTDGTDSTDSTDGDWASIVQPLGGDGPRPCCMLAEGLEESDQ